MSTATITPAAPALLSAEEFLKLHGDDSGIELVKGRIVRLPMPGLNTAASASGPHFSSAN